MSVDRTILGKGEFPSTAWTMIVRAGGDGEEARLSLGKLCQLYWEPLYVFARRSGCSREDAQDRTQGFFAKMIEGNYLERARQEKGRLRTFLLTCFKRFLRDEWRKEQTEKRGGKTEVVDLDFEGIERTLEGNAETPDRIYERRWALAVLDGALDSLKSEYEEKGKVALFRELKPFLMPGATSDGYREASERLGLSENAIGVAVFRFRKRFGELMKWQVLATVESEDEVEAELRHLMSVLV